MFIIRVTFFKIFVSSEILNILIMTISHINSNIGIFLIYLSVQLLRDDGRLHEGETHKAPGFLTGAIMQWLNPKAWLASASGIFAYLNRSYTTQ